MDSTQTVTGSFVVDNGERGLFDRCSAAAAEQLESGDLLSSGGRAGLIIEAENVSKRRHSGTSYTCGHGPVDDLCRGRDLRLTDCEWVTKMSMPTFVNRPDLHLTNATVSTFSVRPIYGTYFRSPKKSKSKSKPRFLPRKSIKIDR